MRARQTSRLDPSPLWRRLVEWLRRKAPTPNTPPPTILDAYKMGTYEAKCHHEDNISYRICPPQMLQHDADLTWSFRLGYKSYWAEIRDGEQWHAECDARDRREAKREKDLAVWFEAFRSVEKPQR